MWPHAMPCSKGVGGLGSLRGLTALDLSHTAVGEPALAHSSAHHRI